LDEWNPPAPELRRFATHYTGERCGRCGYFTESAG
jgi:hypothetical protein